jgi:hypothetical protein
MANFDQSVFRSFSVSKNPRVLGQKFAAALATAAAARKREAAAAPAPAPAAKRQPHVSGLPNLAKAAKQHRKAARVGNAPGEPLQLPPAPAPAPAAPAKSAADIAAARTSAAKQAWATRRADPNSAYNRNRAAKAAAVAAAAPPAAEIAATVEKLAARNPLSRAAKPAPAKPAPAKPAPAAPRLRKRA